MIIKDRSGVYDLVLADRVFSVGTLLLISNYEMDATFLVKKSFNPSLEFARENELVIPKMSTAKEFVDYLTECGFISPVQSEDIFDYCI